MRSICIFSLFVALLTIPSCQGDDKKEVGKVVLNFKLKYGNEDLLLFKNYKYPEGDKKLFFNRFSFYLSEVTLKGAKGENKILDVDYLDLTNTFSDQAQAAKGFSYEIKDVVADSYSSLKFSIGVPKESNDKNPASFSSSNILSKQAEYWIDWKSYIFTRTEGQIDLDGDGTTEEGFSLHTGSNSSFKTLEFPIAKQLQADGTVTYNVIIDLKRQFGVGPYYDIVNHTQIHSASQVTQVKSLIENLVAGISTN